MKEIIAKLKQNEKPLFLLSHEERSVIEGLGTKNCQIFQEFDNQAAWCNMVGGKINKLDASYRIKPDYQPEPEYVDLEIKQYNGKLGVEWGEHATIYPLGLCPDFSVLHGLPSLPNFAQFFIGDMRLSLEEVASHMTSKRVIARFRI